MARLAVPERLHPAYSLAAAAFAVALNYAVGPILEFPGIYIVPVVLASWYGGLRWGMPMSLLPFARILIITSAGAPVDVYAAVLSTSIRAMVFAAIALWIASLAAAQHVLRHEVEMLQGMLPICSYCKKIRDEAGQWQVVEKYIGERTDATFTHGICETCLAREAPAWKRA